MTLIEKAEVAAFLLLTRCVIGCHALTPAQQAQADLYECRVAALLPYVAPALDTSLTVRDIMTGHGSLDDALKALGYAEEQAAKIKAELAVCDPPPVVTAPPPAPGDKVL